MLERIQKSIDFIRTITKSTPKICIILGSGLSSLKDYISIDEIIRYSEIPYFPISTVKGHKGELVFGNISGTEVVLMNGRFHYYEGYSMQEITFPIRVAKQLGVEYLFLSNAAGGMNNSYSIGDIMFIEDHINLMGDNPLIGHNIDELGPRFVDMLEPYDRDLINSAINIAQKKSIKYHKGVYVAVPGPCFETPAEYRYLAKMGADAVGMSTVPENIVAIHSGMKCFATSIITDLGFEGHFHPISHKEVLQVANKSANKINEIIIEMIKKM